MLGFLYACYRMLYPSTLVSVTNALVLAMLLTGCVQHMLLALFLVHMIIIIITFLFQLYKEQTRNRKKNLSLWLLYYDYQSFLITPVSLYLSVYSKYWCRKKYNSSLRSSMKLKYSCWNNLSHLLHTTATSIS